MNWTVYLSEDNRGTKRVALTSENIELLAKIDDHAKVTILHQVKVHSTAERLYNREVSNLRRNRKLKLTNVISGHTSRMGLKYGSRNGTIAGRLAVSSGRLNAIVKARYLCPDGHESNGSMYKVYCHARGLDPNKAIKLSK